MKPLVELKISSSMKEMGQIGPSFALMDQNGTL
jgi:hypothetical protein